MCSKWCCRQGTSPPNSYVMLLYAFCANMNELWWRSRCLPTTRAHTIKIIGNAPVNVLTFDFFTRNTHSYSWTAKSMNSFLKCAYSQYQGHRKIERFALMLTATAHITSFRCLKWGAIPTEVSDTEKGCFLWAIEGNTGDFNCPYSKSRSWLPYAHNQRMLTLASNWTIIWQSLMLACVSHY